MRPPVPRRRVAVVVQRYGPGIAGGAEWHARALVDALKPHHDVSVLTSCAADASTWAAQFPPGVTHEDGITIERFAHPLRNAGGRARVPLRHKLRWWGRALLDRLGGTRVPQPVGDDRLDGHLFLRQQGPACDGLLERLRQREHEVVVFFTALYHPTAEGLPLWGQRSVLVPTLHDEKPMQLPWFHRVFASAGQTLYNTAAEARLARRLYGRDAADGEVVGAGVAVQVPSAAAMATARERHGLQGRYLVYVGRIEKGKGCGDLLDAWQALQGQTGDAVLVFVGKGAMPIPATPRLRATGFVADAERDALIAGAVALVMPSRYESLSLVLLEALALGVPALANGDCEPLAEHLQASGAGTAYRGGRQLRRGLLEALSRSDVERQRLGEAGQRYTAAHYGWAHVQQRWLAAVEQAASA